MRPEDAELDAGLEEFGKFLDQIGVLPTFKKIQQGSDIAKLRRFAHEDEGEAHMLLRPVGQVALGQAVGVLVFEKKIPLETIFAKLKKFDQQGRFRLDQPSSLFYMVLYDPNKKRMLVSGRDLASRLLQYMLGGGIEDDTERDALRKELAEARTFEDKAIGFDGKASDPERLDLPPSL